MKQTLGECAIALVAMVFKSGSMNRIGAEMPCTDPVMLAADHAPQPCEVALGMGGADAVAAIGVGMGGAAQVKGRLQQIPMWAFVG